MRRPIVLTLLFVVLFVTPNAWGEKLLQEYLKQKESGISNRDFYKRFVFEESYLETRVLPTIVAVGDRNFYGSSLRVGDRYSGKIIEEIRLEGGILKDSETTGAFIKITARW